MKNVKVVPIESIIGNGKTGKNGSTFAIACSIGLLFSLTACSSSNKTADTTKSGETTTSTTTTTSATPDATPAGDATKADTSKEAPTTSTTANTTTVAAPASADAEKGAIQPAGGAKDDMPQISAASRLVKLNGTPDTKVICTVNGTPITVGDYKHEFKLREEQTQAMIAMQPEIEEQLVNDAKHNNIALTDIEKQRLLESAKKAEGGKGDALQKYLKDNKISGEEFNQKVLRVGVALKDAAHQTQGTLLNELVDQQIMIQYSRSKGYAQKAFNKYMELKRTPQYKTFLEQTGFSPDEAQTQLVNRQLMMMAVEDIKKKTPQPTEKELEQVYDLNKTNLKHGERIRLSQIIVAAPEKDLPDQPSLRTQVSKQDPALKGEALDAKVKQQEEVQKNKAQAILEQIQKGADFAKVANEKSDDPLAKQSKNGGDIGYKDITLLVKEFAAKVKGVKVGDLVPEVVKTEFGYHVVKVTGREPAGTVPLSEVKDEITTQLMQRKNLSSVVNFLASQHKSADVKLTPDFQALVAEGAKATGTKVK